MGFFRGLDRNKHNYYLQKTFQATFRVPISGLRVELDLDFLILIYTLVYIRDQI